LTGQQSKITILAQQGLDLHQHGKLNDAQNIYEKILSIQEDNFDALQLLGALFAQVKKYPQAVESLSKALIINPNHAGCYSNLGFSFQKLKRLEEALSSYDKAISLQADYAEAYSNRGLVLQELQRLEEALSSYDKAISLQADYAEAYYNRGTALHKLKRLEEALSSYDKAISLQADFAEVYYNRGNVLQELQRLEEALSSYDKAISLQADYAEVYSNRGNVLQELQRLEEALSSYDKAISLQANYAEAYCNRGTALHKLKRLEEALSSYDKAISLQADFAEAYLSSSLCYLLAGNFNDGWARHEWRWQSEGMSKTAGVKNFSQPLWLGKESLKDQTILLYAEQGLGDTIQFSRYVSLVATLGAKVVLEVQPSLVKLLSHLEGISQIINKGDKLPHFDYQCPLLSLPLAFKTELQTIPSASQNISSDIEKVAKWQAILGEKTKPRAGIVWSGSAAHKNDHQRSLTLSKLITYLPSDYEYVSLQKEISDVDKEVLTKHNEIKHFGGDLKDFTDTAALCELIDIVISVDTSVAHLAGTLGKTTWILLPYSPDWRWLLDRNDSPWYSSVKLYRQEKINDWDGVLVNIESDLKGLRNGS
jgi:tetratricopeptide (TPR) repeat protein